MVDFTSSRAFRVAGPTAFAEAGITHNDVDHLMIYDAFFRLSIYSFEDLGFIPHTARRSRRLHRGAQHRPGVPGTARRAGRPGIPLNTNGGGLSYMHSGITACTPCRESVPQMRGTAPAQIPGAGISVCHGVGGMFAASGTIIMSNEPP